MSKYIAVCLAILCFSGLSVAQEKAFVPDEILVKWKGGLASDGLEKTSFLHGAEVKESFPEINWQRLKLPEGVSVDNALRQMSFSTDVEAVQPNFYYHLLATPNDSRFSTLYGMQKISAPAAWDLTTGSSEVVVADIDTGLRYTHEDLAANAWRNAGEINGNGIDDDGNGLIDDYYGYDFFYNDSNPFDDAGGHGTHTAGTIGAIGNNTVGVAGVNWNVKIMAIKIYSPAGTDSTSAMLINAYNYVRRMKERGVNIRVTNNSYGGCGEACGYDQATKDALDAMGDAGILNVFAAGNDNTNIETSPAYPASYTSPSVLSVASSTSTDARSGFSNYGAVSVDVAAPGSGITSTFAGSDTSYTSMSGTSMATPHVAGAAALLSAYNPSLSAASLKASLMNNVDVLANWNGVVKTGGRINVLRALQNQTVCNFTPVASTSTFTANGGSGTLLVNASTNCDYTVSSNVEWLKINTPSPLSGAGSISFTVTPNATNLSRTARVRVGVDGYITITQNANSSPTNRAVLDFDGDGKTDFSVLENSNGSLIWHNNLSANGYRGVNFGLAAQDVAVPNDFDGDGKTDVAVWRSATQSTFYWLRSSDSTIGGFQFGTAGDNPRISQDFDGDGKCDFAVTRNVGGQTVWYLQQSTAGFRAVQFGLSGDKPLRGDFDGDAKADIAVYRPQNLLPANTFFIFQSSNNVLRGVNFGLSDSDRIVPADYDGDGKTDVAVWRTTNGVWYVVRSSDNQFYGYQFGISTDAPVVGDYDGDGKADFAVWRANANATQTSIFYVNGTAGGIRGSAWGNGTMTATLSSYFN